MLIMQDKEGSLEREAAAGGDEAGKPAPESGKPAAAAVQASDPGKVLEKLMAARVGAMVTCQLCRPMVWMQPGWCGHQGAAKRRGCLSIVLSCPNAWQLMQQWPVGILRTGCIALPGAGGSFWPA